MILITGASRNNGSEIVRLLSQQGLHVRAMTRKQHDRNPIPNDNVEFVTADFDDVDVGGSAARLQPDFRSLALF